MHITAPHTDSGSLSAKQHSTVLLKCCCCCCYHHHYDSRCYALVILSVALRPCCSPSGLTLVSHRSGPGSRLGSMWGLWWTKRHWGRFSPSTSVFPANHHSTNFSIIIITWGWYNRPVVGRSDEWTQLDSTPHYTN
jgi:hypothetical protein